ncbi:hypothetical protein GF322_03400 [Candidatus Dependentiae bacterium]|nr:hypothetical protein [Candidatus Dependentiae bacterium]
MNKTLNKTRFIILVLLLFCFTYPNVSLAKKNKLSKKEQKELLLQVLSKKDNTISNKTNTFFKSKLKQFLILGISTTLGAGTTLLLNKNFINDLSMVIEYVKENNMEYMEYFEEFNIDYFKELNINNKLPKVKGTLKPELITMAMELICFTIIYDIALNLLFKSKNDNTDEEIKQKIALALAEIQKQENLDDNYKLDK